MSTQDWALLLAAGSVVLSAYAVWRIHHLTTGANRMATKSEFDDLVARFNTATNAIAARITALEGKITDAGLPADVEASVLAELGGIADGLEALGANPDNPVPEPEPTPDDPGPIV